jgi:hypothetical protein
MTRVFCDVFEGDISFFQQIHIMQLIQKKQVISFIGILMLILMGTSRAYSQSYNQSLLINKKWKYQMPEKTFYFSVLFTTKEEVVDLIVDGKKTGDEMNSFYYLSNKIVYTFQRDSVGISKSGKYIVVLRIPKFAKERVELYEILELTDTILKIKNLQSGKVTECNAE